MAARIAINGFGRIGRLVFRLASKEKNLEIVAINDIVPPDNLAYLLKYDSTHGPFPGEVKAEKNDLIVNGRKVLCFAEKEPEKLPWKDLKIDFVIESTGHFTSIEGAQKHIQAGAKKVVISAPAKEGIPTFVYGINHESYDPKKDDIVSNASCTTTCLVTIAKVLDEHFGMEESLMTTVHAITATQPTVDGPSKKDWRGGRSGLQNIIPAQTGAAKAATLVLPNLKGKITGMAFRVPVEDVSVVDLTFKTKKKTNYADICAKMKEESEKSLKGLLKYCDEEMVSSDFIGTTYSAIFDEKAGIELNPNFFKVVAWYDNEMGYSARVVDFLKFMEQKR